MLRKTLSLYGVRAESEIREIKNVAQQILTNMQAAAQQAQAGKPGGAAPSLGLSETGAPQNASLESVLANMASLSGPRGG